MILRFSILFLISLASLLYGAYGMDGPSHPHFYNALMIMGVTGLVLLGMVATIKVIDGPKR
jgi:hypothetical protein